MMGQEKKFSEELIADKEGEGLEAGAWLESDTGYKMLVTREVK